VRGIALTQSVPTRSERTGPALVPRIGAIGVLAQFTEAAVDSKIDSLLMVMVIARFFVHSLARSIARIQF
jgi:hypothetical protein